MPLRIKADLCTSCGLCERVCISNTLQLKNGLPVVLEDSRCWHCMACVKVCPKRAISITLPPDISPENYEMIAYYKDKSIVFQILKDGDPVETYSFEVMK